jgi:C-terminal processing protease CtpA/Prc
VSSCSRGGGFARRAAFALAACAALACEPAQPPEGPPAPAVTAPPEAAAPAPPPPAVESTPPAPLDPRVERLVRLCQVWAQVRWFHPWIFERAVDWDAALTAAIPKVSAATTGAEEDAAVEQMLRALGDPATRLAGAPPPTKPPSPARSRWVDPKTLVLEAGTFAGADVRKLLRGLPDEIRKAETLVVDLRPDAEPFEVDTLLGALAPLLPSREITGPSQRSVLHQGYRPQRGGSSGNYTSGLVDELPEVWKAATGHRPARIAFLANDRSYVPGLAIALQRAGDAEMVGEGDVSDEAIIVQRTVPRGDRPAALVRVTELDAPLQADLRLPPGAPAASLDATLAYLRKPRPKARSPRPGTTPTSAPAWRPDEVYAGEPYPSRERRLLALFRLWSTIHFFYPYLHLMGDAWDRGLREMIPRFEAAGTAEAYAFAVAGMARRMEDGHVGVFGSDAIDRLEGAAGVPFTVQRLDGRPVVTAFTDEAAAKAAGVALGDEIVSVDGEPIDARAQRISPVVSASNPWSMAYMTVLYAMRGPAGSTAVIALRGADGQVREVRVPRSSGPPPPPATPPFRILPEGFGYADLTRLLPGEVDAMFEAFAKAPGIVFDMRGYPHQTAWPIGARLAACDHTAAAMFLRPVLTAQGDAGRYQHLQLLSTTDKPRYRGPTVMLVDERAISQAEHTGLFFEAANHTRFVGSPTAGANGDVTVTCLPGNLCVSFTGHDVRHADGRQLQRVGLVPDVPVRPTIAGLRAGRDEVREKAVETLRAAGGKAPQVTCDPARSAE